MLTEIAEKAKSYISNVTEFVYLESTLTLDNDCTKDIKARTPKAKEVMTGFTNV